MKPVIALVLTGALSLVFEISAFPPYSLTELVIKFFLVFTVCSVLLAACLLPWYKAPFSTSWRSALLYGFLISFTAFDLGYLTFSLSTIL